MAREVFDSRRREITEGKREREIAPFSVWRCLSLVSIVSRRKEAGDVNNQVGRAGCEAFERRIRSQSDGEMPIENSAGLVIRCRNRRLQGIVRPERDEAIGYGIDCGNVSHQAFCRRR